jgi:hypothetical protein
MTKELSTCIHCKSKIIFAKGRGSKPSGPAWRHVESGARVCPGTFRATPTVEVKMDREMIVPMSEWTDEQKEQWALRYLKGRKLTDTAIAVVISHTEAKKLVADG